MSTSLAYYRSFPYELVTMWLMLAGTLSFGAHYHLWRGPRNILRNLETKTMAASVILGTTILFIGLARTDIFVDTPSVVRRGFLHLLSAHTSTGFATVTGSDLASWGGLAFAAIATAMALGGMGSSTSGGVKALRVGLTIKVIVNTVKETLLPEHSVIRPRYYQNGNRQLSPRLAQSVLVVSLLFVALYLFGTVVGLVYGFPLQDAMFESVSAAGTVGLSVGVTNPAMPIGLQITYLLLMWASRLEFIALFSLAGFALATVIGE